MVTGRYCEYRPYSLAKRSSHTMDKRETIPELTSVGRDHQDADELVRLRAQVRELQDALRTKPEEDDTFKFAREIFEGLTNKPASREEAVMRVLKYTVLAGDLKPEMAPFFIHKLHDPMQKEHRAEILSLIMTCAGPPATGVLKEFLQTPHREKDEQSAITESLLGEGYGHHLIPVIPVDEELRAMANQKLGSAEQKERELGVAVLAQDAIVTSRGWLQATAQSDPSEHIRLAAISALKISGDETTLVFLERLMGKVPEPWSFERAIVTSEDRLAYEIGKAYNIIQHRLQK